MAHNNLSMIILRRIYIYVLIAMLLLSVAGTPRSVVHAAPPDYTGPEPVLVDDINKGAASSSPRNLTAIGSILFFRADDDDYGQELWMSYPPYDSAALVADIYPGDTGSWPEELVVLGRTLFFSADDSVHGREIWKCDPPYNSARRVTDINPNGDSSPHHLIPIGEELFFSANNGSHGFELWKSGPPYTSATMISDIYPGLPGSAPDELMTIGWMLFFNANDSSGRELWKCEPPYNKTTTVRVADIQSGFGSSEPHELTPIDTILFFVADDGVSGVELWKSEPPYDETSTERANDIDRPFGSDPYDLFAIGNTLFFTGNIGTSGYELRRTVPPYNTTNTFRVADIYPGHTGQIPNSSFPNKKISIGSTLFFTAANSDSGIELWKSDPPYDEDTTFLVAEINPDSGHSIPNHLTVVGNNLLFTADDGTYGRELWQSELPYNENSTVRVADIQRGIGSSNPDELAVIGETLFFNADDINSGLELWKLGDDFLLPATGFAPGVVTHLDKQPMEKVYTKFDTLQLEIPSLGVKSQLVGVPTLDTGWDLTWLGDNAGYLDNTAFPTWPGNTVITAHAYMPDGSPGPFMNLEALKWGNRFVINAWGHRHIYEVRSMGRVNPDDLSVLDHEDLDWVTLITCQGFDEELGSYRWRVVVRAVLVQIE